MNIVTTIKDWQQIRKTLKNLTIGFVPTMGNLHAGHLSLCTKSKKANDITVVSIFINPTQFNNQDDLVNYPKTLLADQALLTAHEIDYLFLPQQQEIYPDGYQVKVSETEISHLLEGEMRPLHFTGMLTIVLKLFNLVQPTRTYFGEKDYQQLLLVKKMVAALFLPIEVIACATIRADDQLPLSSRNNRLNAEERQLASHFSRLLQSNHPIPIIKAELEKLGFIVEYIADQWQRRLAAVRLGHVRLIDNIPLKG